MAVVRPAFANRIMDRYDLCVATRDHHPPDHGSFAVNHRGGEVGRIIDLDGLDQVLWPVHCVQGTRGSELVDELDREKIAAVFPKGAHHAVDSYSGFFDNGRRRGTGLAEYLREQGVSRVDIMGLATDYCVKFTALDAASLGFDTRLLVAGCRAVNLKSGDDQRALDEMEAAGVTLVREINS